MLLHGHWRHTLSFLDLLTSSQHLEPYLQTLLAAYHREAGTLVYALVPLLVCGIGPVITPLGLKKDTVALLAPVF